MITRIRYHTIKKGRNAGSKMAVLILEDLQGQAEVVMFADVLNKYGGYLAEDKVIFVKGRIDCRRAEPNVFASELIALDEVAEKLAARVRIELDAVEVTKQKVAEIKSICRHHRGGSAVYVAIRTEQATVHVKADTQLSVNPDMDFCRKMRRLVGEENFQLAR